jgi:hypothetical protein
VFSEVWSGGIPSAASVTVGREDLHPPRNIYHLVDAFPPGPQYHPRKETARGVIAALKGETMNPTFPGESAEYRAARDRLLEQEIELRRAMEAVAAARRELPPGGPIPEDYVFQGAGEDS